MNFGNFLRNLSSEREPSEETRDGDKFSSSGLFSAPSRLLGSVTAKTGNLVAEIGHKVDFSNTLGSIKKHTSIDKISQSVIGSTFANAPWKEKQVNEMAEVEDGTKKLSVKDNRLVEIEQSWGNLNTFNAEPAAERHENPFNYEGSYSKKDSLTTSFDLVDFVDDAINPLPNFEEKMKKTPIIRQNTTPKPPRPPPPKSGSHSMSVDDSFEHRQLSQADLYSLDERKEPTAAPTMNGDRLRKDSTELDYLTRLQCQEIISEVDSMIAKDFEDLEPKRTDSVNNRSGFVAEMVGGNLNEFYSHEDKLLVKNTDSEPLLADLEYTTSQRSYCQKNHEMDRPKKVQADGGDVKFGKAGQSEVEENKKNERKKAEEQVYVEEYILDLLTGNESIVEMKNDEFKRLMFTTAGRENFAKAMETEGARNNGLLSECGLRMLLSRVIFVLVECQKCDDFVPAKRILTTSLVFHIEDPMKKSERIFLFSYIKSQPIWHSLKFWNACFFQSVQESRAKLLEDGRSNVEIDIAILGQIRSYLDTMQVFDLHSTMRQEFLRKQGELFNLRQDDIEQLSNAIDEDDEEDERIE